MPATGIFRAVLAVALVVAAGCTPFEGDSFAVPGERFPDDVYAVSEYYDQRGRKVYPTSDGRLFYAEVQRKGYLHLARESRRRQRHKTVDKVERSLTEAARIEARSQARVETERRRLAADRRRAERLRQQERARQGLEVETDQRGSRIEADGAENRRLQQRDFVETRQARIRDQRRINALERERRRALRRAEGQERARSAAERQRQRADRALQRQERRSRRLGIGELRVLRKDRLIPDRDARLLRRYDRFRLPQEEEDAFLRRIDRAQRQARDERNSTDLRPYLERQLGDDKK
ncbi:MAG: hypothetical protein AAF713_07525 [Pseudomonadota bacterium]